MSIEYKIRWALGLVLTVLIVMSEHVLRNGLALIVDVIDLFRRGRQEVATRALGGLDLDLYIVEAKKSFALTGATWRCARRVMRGPRSPSDCPAAAPRMNSVTSNQWRRDGEVS